MRKTLDSAITNNKQVIFVIDNPNLRFDPKQCLAGRPLSRNLSIKQSCTILRSTYEKESKIYRDLVLSVLNESSTIISSAKLRESIAAIICSSSLKVGMIPVILLDTFISL